jgi:Holliday junction resolvasome RuvABC endonuclease subunit
MSKVTLGLDLSLKSAGVAVIRDGKLVHHEAVVYEPKKRHMAKTKTGKSDTLSSRQLIERLVFVRDKVQSIAVEFEPDSIAIEGYAYAAHSSSVTGLAELGGVIRVLCAEELNIIPQVFTVGQCRKFVVGRGNVTKASTQVWLKEKGFKFPTDDEGDAFVVGLTGFYASYPSYRGALTVKQLEMINGIAEDVRRKAGPR